MATEYISTEMGCQYLRKYKIEDGTSFLYDEGFNDGIETAISCIGNEVPAADVRPVVHGHYIGEYDGYADGNPVYDMWYCSECGCVFEDWDEKPTYNFCPNSGCAIENEK